MAKNKNIKMSEDLLGMHFMRSTRIKIDEKAKKKILTEMAEEYRGRKIPINKNKNAPSRYVFCPDIGYNELQNLKYGRFAFNGINPEIHRIQLEEENARRRRNDPNLDDDEGIFKDIPDEEMAKSSFSSARRYNGRGVFIEPADKILNIYTEETDAPLSTGPSSNNTATSSNVRSPSQRFAPYRRGQKQDKNSGNQNKRFGNRKK